MSMEEIRFSQMTTFGDYLYMRDGEIAEIIMENTRTGIRKTIVDDDGMIADFPGFAYPKLVSRYSDGIPTARISFRSDISRLGEQYTLIWQIQPDGRYWEDDDGFGGTSDDEIDLYARMDETGYFIEPFHFYSIGSSKLYGTDAEEQLMQTLQMKGDPLASSRAHTDTYRIVNNEGGVLNVGMVNLYQSAEVETTAPSVIISVVDDAHMNQVQVEGMEGDQYLVALCSELPGDEDISELQFSGQTSNVPMTVGVTDHALNLTNCPGVCMLVNGTLTAIPEQDTLKSITEYGASLEYTACVYDGTAKTPNVRFGGEYELKQNVDYVVIYDQNTEIGQAQATVWGVGAYTGNVVLNFNIVATEQELCPNGHQWDEGTVTQKPSFTADGTVTYTCRVCGAKQTESLAGLYYHRVSRSESAVTVSLTNNTSATLNARICLVGYDESGKMTCLNMKTIALSGGNMTQLKLSFGGNAPAKIKAMLLEDARMMPIGSAWLVP